MWAEQLDIYVLHANCTWFAKRDVPRQKGIKEWRWTMDLVHGENIIRSVNESNWKKQTLKGLMRERESHYNN